MPEASASPSAIATLIALSLANDAMAYTRTTVDRRWLVVAECFMVFRELDHTNVCSYLHVATSRYGTSTTVSDNTRDSQTLEESGGIPTF